MGVMNQQIMTLSTVQASCPYLERLIASISFPRLLPMTWSYLYQTQRNATVTYNLRCRTIKGTQTPQIPVLLRLQLR
jgi:hypothetical protein